MKRLISLALCLILLLSVLGTGVSASAETIGVYCKAPENWSQCYIYWWGSSFTNPDWPGYLMTADVAGYWYYELPMDADGLIFYNGDGTQSKDLSLPTCALPVYYFEQNRWCCDPKPPVYERYYVAGSAGLCGVEWDPGAAENEMMETPDGTYAITYTGVSAGDYELKVTVGSWVNCWGLNGGDQNYPVTVAQDNSQVVVTFDPSTRLIDVEVTNDEFLIADNTVTFSTPEDIWLSGGHSFVPAADGNVTVEVTECDPDFFLEVWADDDWLTDCFGSGPDVFHIPVSAGITYEFYMSPVEIVAPDLFDYAAGFVTYRITADVGFDQGGDDVGYLGPDSLAIVGDGIPGVKTWDPADPAGDMTEIAPYFYQLTLECSGDTTMHFKFVGNDVWDDAWNFGDAAVTLGTEVDMICGPGTSDMLLQVDEACTLLFTVDLKPMLSGGNAMLLVNKVNSTPQPRPLIVYAPDSWEKVYAYTWEPETFGSYPGRELQKQVNYFTETINSNMENLILTGYLEDASYRQTSDIYIQPGDDIVVVFVFEDGTYDVTYDAGPIWDNYGSLTIAGSGLPGIREWDSQDTTGDMINIGGGVFQKILTFPEPTTIYFRIVSDHDWLSGHAGGGNIVLGQPIDLDTTVGSPDFVLEIPEACQLKFTLDLSARYVDQPGTLLVEKVSSRKLTVKAPAAWTGVDAYTWEPETLGSFPGTAMQKNGDVFELMIPADMVNLVLSGTLGDGTRQQYTDMQLEPGSYDLTIDISGGEGPDPILSNYRVTGNAVWMGNWDPASDMGRMLRISDYEYQKRFQYVQPGFYECKITKNGIWENAVGNEDGSNIAFLVLQTGDVIVTYNELTGNVEIVVDNASHSWKLNSLALLGDGIPGVPEGDYTAPEAQMTEVGYNVFEKVLDIPAGSSMFFWFIGKDSRNTSWGFGGRSITLGETLELNGKPDASSLELYVAEECQVKITVDLNPMLSGGNATLLVEKIDEPASTRTLTVYAPDSWQYVNAYTWDPESFGIWPGARIQRNGDCYQATISGTMTNLVVNGTLADGTMVKTDDICLETNGLDVTVYIQEDGSHTLRYAEETAHARSLTVVVPSASWNSVYAYTWEPESLGAYPGKKMEVNEGVVYRDIISSELVNLVISGSFADGTGWKTGDIRLEPGVRPVIVMLREDLTYTIIYDNSPADGDAYRVVGSADWMGLWDCASDQGLMEKISEGVYQKRFENVMPGSYEFKITKNGKWDECIGQADGSNFAFTVSSLSEVTVTYTFDAGDIAVTVGITPLPIGDVTGDGKLNMGDVARLYAHIRGTRPLTDENALLYADFNGDGKINIGDTAGVYAYIQEEYMQTVS